MCGGNGEAQFCARFLKSVQTGNSKNIRNTKKIILSTPNKKWNFGLYKFKKNTSEHFLSSNYGFIVGIKVYDTKGHCGQVSYCRFDKTLI